jgi:hypothetical protein
VSSYYYICVLILLYTCPHTYYYTKCILGTPLSYVRILLYMCPHTTIYVSLYYYIYVSSHTCRSVAVCGASATHSSSYYICVLTLLYVSSYYYMCPHTTVYVSSYYYMCPHTTIYVASYYCICVLILLYVSSYYVSSHYYMCPHM